MCWSTFPAAGPLLAQRLGSNAVGELLGRQMLDFVQMVAMTAEFSVERRSSERTPELKAAEQMTSKRAPDQNTCLLA